MPSRAKKAPTRAIAPKKRASNKPRKDDSPKIRIKGDAQKSRHEADQSSKETARDSTGQIATSSQAHKPPPSSPNPSSNASGATGQSDEGPVTKRLRERLAKSKPQSTGNTQTEIRPAPSLTPGSRGILEHLAKSVLGPHPTNNLAKFIETHSPESLAKILTSSDSSRHQTKAESGDGESNGGEGNGQEHLDHPPVYQTISSTDLALIYTLLHLLCPDKGVETTPERMLESAWAVLQLAAIKESDIKSRFTSAFLQRSRKLGNYRLDKEPDKELREIGEKLKRSKCFDTFFNSHTKSLSKLKYLPDEINSKIRNEAPNLLAECRPNDYIPIRTQVEIWFLVEHNLTEISHRKSVVDSLWERSSFTTSPNSKDFEYLERAEYFLSWFKPFMTWRKSLSAAVKIDAGKKGAKKRKSKAQDLSRQQAAGRRSRGWKDIGPLVR